MFFAQQLMSQVKPLNLQKKTVQGMQFEVNAFFISSMLHFNIHVMFIQTLFLFSDWVCHPKSKFLIIHLVRFSNIAIIYYIILYLLYSVMDSYFYYIIDQLIIKIINEKLLCLYWMTNFLEILLNTQWLEFSSFLLSTLLFHFNFSFHLYAYTQFENKILVCKLMSLKIFK